MRFGFANLGTAVVLALGPWVSDVAGQPQTIADAPPRLQLLARHSLGIGGAEIIDYCRQHQVLLTTFSDEKAGRHGVEVVALEDPADPHPLRWVGFDSDSLPAGGVIGSVSSVAVDPLGRGFGAVTLIPADSPERPGALVLFDFLSGQVLKVVSVGYHPDCVTFSADGRFVITADEAEYHPRRTQKPGSISVLDLGANRVREGIASIAESSVETYTFDAQHLADGVDLSGLRRHHGSSDLPIGMILEPEYVSELNGLVYVSLQENNALGVFDLKQRKWLNVFNLGSRMVHVDASDRDGRRGAGAAIIDDLVRGLPMPDTIKAFEWKGRAYVVTANEGDARAHDEGDVMRLKHAGRRGPAIAASTEAELRQRYGRKPLADAYLGRLEVSIFDGLNEAGEIAEPTMFGTRGFSILDGMTGELIFDSGSFIEEFALQHDPATFNMNDGKVANMDDRSDNKGPEPEALAVAHFAGKLWMAVGTERQNGLFLLIVDELAAPRLFAYANPHLDGDFSPESILLIPGDHRPDAANLMIAAFEGSGTILVYRVYPSS